MWQSTLNLRDGKLDPEIQVRPEGVVLQQNSSRTFPEAGRTHLLDCVEQHLLGCFPKYAQLVKRNDWSWNHCDQASATICSLVANSFPEHDVKFMVQPCRVWKLASSPEANETFRTLHSLANSYDRQFIMEHGGFCGAHILWFLCEEPELATMRQLSREISSGMNKTDIASWTQKLVKDESERMQLEWLTQHLYDDFKTRRINPFVVEPLCDHWVTFVQCNDCATVLLCDFTTRQFSEELPPTIKRVNLDEARTDRDTFRRFCFLHNTGVNDYSLGYSFRVVNDIHTPKEFNEARMAIKRSGWSPRVIADIACNVNELG